MNIPLVKSCSWQEIKEKVAAVNSELTAIIDAISPDGSYSFILAKYPYGARIFDRKETIISVDANTELPLSDSQVPSNILNELNYRYFPTGLVLEKMVEVYFETEERTVPMRLFQKGEIIGLWQLFDPPNQRKAENIWKLSSGLRSIFLLPTISDAIAHGRLRRTFNIRSPVPKTLVEHQKIFVEILSKITLGKAWQCKILYFGKKWAEEIDNNLALSELRAYLLAQAWNQSLYCRSLVAFDAAQEEFSKKIAARNLKPKPYILNTINHLSAISKSMFPGFVPAFIDEEAAPIRAIQDAYVNTYLLKQYIPIIMQPLFLNRNEGYPIYYSLSFPTLLDIGARAIRSANIMADLRELKMLMEIRQNYYASEDIQYAFYHSETDKYGEILSSATLPNTDSRFLDYSPAFCSNKEFPYNGQFLRGCIQIIS